MGFFSASTTASKKPIGLLPACGECGLFEKCKTPKFPYIGEGARGILFVGDQPSDREDREGVLLRGEAGDLVRKCVTGAGMSFERDCWYVPSVICHKGSQITPKELAACRPNLVATIKELQPKVVVAMGFNAVKQTLVPVYRESVGRMATWAGWKVPLRSMNTWICPVSAPAAVVASKDDREGAVTSLIFTKQMTEALNLATRPYDTVPDYNNEVRPILNTDEAVQWLKDCIAAGRPTAFDWETNALKPEAPGAKLVSVGLFNGIGKAVAFRCDSEKVRQALVDFCTSPLPKIGANNKFEDRWARTILGVPIKNWAWDCMLSAHHLDNRTDITSVKFQAFVRLGVAPWDTVVKPFFSSSDAMSLNSIDKIDTDTLLKYNALDAIIEYRVAEHQRDEMRYQNAL